MSIIKFAGELGPTLQKLLLFNCANVTLVNTKLNVHLANAIGTKHLTMHKTMDCKQMVPAVFDSYLGTAMLPDHLELGLIENVLLLSLKSLETTPLAMQ